MAAAGWRQTLRLDAAAIILIGPAAGIENLAHDGLATSLAEQSQRQPLSQRDPAELIDCRL